MNHEVLCAANLSDKKYKHFFHYLCKNKNVTKDEGSINYHLSYFTYGM